MTVKVVRDSEEADVVVVAVDSQVEVEDSQEVVCLEAACPEDSEAAVEGPFNGNPPIALSCYISNVFNKIAVVVASFGGRQRESVFPESEHSCQASVWAVSSTSLNNIP